MNNKSLGMDNITTEMLRPEVRQPFDSCVRSATKCGIWEWFLRTGKMVLSSLYPGKRNIAKCDNWRRVTLLSIPGKVYCLMILNQLRDITDGKLHEKQAGFRPKPSYAEQIFILQHFTEKCEGYQNPLQSATLTSVRAFDSIH